MRRKPDFDRFTTGLPKRVAQWAADEDATSQDLTNLVRSELSRIWKYLIEKINSLEHESKSKDQRIKQLEDALRDMVNQLDCVCGSDYTCSMCRAIEAHKEILDTINKRGEE